MRRPILVVIALLASACSASLPIPPAPGDVSGYFTVDVTGYSGLNRTPGMASGLWVTLEEEAYVAVFDVIHDRGAVLIWPFSEESPRMLPAGETEIPPLTSDEQRIARWRASHLFPGADMGPRSIRPQGFMLVVASSRPLDIDGYLADHDALRRDMGGTFTDMTNGTARILELLIENPAGHNWAWSCVGSPLWCRGR
ncbi:MAG: hypothetical protein ACYTG4_16695 [Planctomycetota bacterium]|jgi:hypothetical protein